jgi:hypothetical protein
MSRSTGYLGVIVAIAAAAATLFLVCGPMSALWFGTPF